jgi:hypothetical protein
MSGIEQNQIQHSLRVVAEHAIRVNKSFTFLSRSVNNYYPVKNRRKKGTKHLSNSDQSADSAFYQYF